MSTVEHSIRWHDPDSAPLSCLEKIKVLNQNYAELRQIAQDALDDAILMGCDAGQVRAAFCELMNSLESPYAHAGPCDK
jgi:hypothetical protein